MEPPGLDDDYLDAYSSISDDTQSDLGSDTAGDPIPDTSPQDSLPEYGYRALIQLAEAKNQINQLQELYEEQQKNNIKLQVCGAVESR